MSFEGCSSDKKGARRRLFASFLGIPLLGTGAPFRIGRALLHACRPPAPIALPNEIHLAILGRYAMSLVYERGIRQYRLGGDKFCQSRALVPVMLVSKLFGKLLRDEWNSHWPASVPLLGSVWMLARPKVFFERFISPVDLSPFSRLRFASLDFRDAFKRMDNTWHLIPLAAKLPPSLEELEFLRVHVPECEVIDLVKQLCPNIRTLRVVFCTQFNNPDCTWWAWHQASADHGYYMKGHELAGVKEYAKAVGRALRQSPRLTNLHVGVYFVPHEAVDTHRTSADHIRYHPIQDSARWLDRFNVQSPVQFQAIWAVRYPSAPAPNIHLPCLADRKLWETPCPLCQRQCADRIERAERLAASIFTVKNPNLRTVSFASFVAEKRTSPSEWEVCRSEDIHPPSRSTVERVLGAGPLLGAQVQVWTKHIGASDRSAQGLVFRLSETGWEDVGRA